MYHQQAPLVGLLSSSYCGSVDPIIGSEMLGVVSKRYRNVVSIVIQFWVTMQSDPKGKEKKMLK